MESFNGKLWNELLNMEIFDTLLAVQVLVERRQREQSTVGHVVHSTIDYGPGCSPAMAAGAVGLTQQVVLQTGGERPCG